MRYNYLAVLDFEATCWAGSDEHEIIEFPTVIVDIEKREIIDKFEQFVKPKHNIILSDFCKNLTTITQEQVNNGIPLKEAIEKHQKFMQKYPKSILVTCGDWDLKTMLPKDAKFNNIIIHNPFYKNWINIKNYFYNFYRGYKKKGMLEMLKWLRLDLVGVHHRGIDDSINTARIAIEMLKHGWVIE